MIRKVLPFLALTIGVGFTIWLIAAESLAAILRSFSQAGWGILAVVAVRAAMITINAAAWKQLLANLVKVSFTVFAFLRWIREAIDALLPVASIGGSLVSARLLTFWRVSGTIALAGVFADVFLQTVAQAIFALVGALLLARAVGFATVPPELLLGLAATMIVLGGFYAVQRYGAGRLLDRAFSVFSGEQKLAVRDGEPGLQSAIERIWRSRRRVAAALTTHTFAWTLGTLEVWLTLHFMQWPMSIEQAIVLESLGTSISTAAFFVPGAWGIQEGGYILIGGLLGVPAHLSLSLSLVKRIPDLTLGAPGLVAWRLVEAHHLFGRRRRNR